MAMGKDAFRRILPSASAVTAALLRGSTTSVHSLTRLAAASLRAQARPGTSIGRAGVTSTITESRRRVELRSLKALPTTGRSPSKGVLE